MRLKQFRYWFFVVLIAFVLPILLLYVIHKFEFGDYLFTMIWLAFCVSAMMAKDNHDKWQKSRRALKRSVDGSLNRAEKESLREELRWEVPYTEDEAIEWGYQAKK